jgi:hypothetical protein
MGELELEKLFAFGLAPKVTEMATIPPSFGTAGPILDSHYTHAELDALFMQNGFPGDPPPGNKTQKCLQWMRRANTESP